jgi:hypothetical protein
LKSIYYVQIISSHSNLINVFILYDLKENLIYFGEDQIKDTFMPIFNINSVDFYKAIPISEFLFKSFLRLSLSDLNKMNKNFFLAFNSLEEWII